MNTSEQLSRHTNVLFATAHGDDFEMHFSAAASQLLAHGSTVRSVVATDGEASTINYSPLRLCRP
jgi:LmbE family N-acetylglucosaminyl deacetylase